MKTFEVNEESRLPHLPIGSGVTML